VNNELLCRTLGIDESTLAQVARDLGNVNPERVREIIQFCIKMSKNPQSMTNNDFDRLREFGVSDEEILEIVIVASHAVSADIIADTLKVPVESDVYSALGR
jgi:alkylhydroperoxidase family enzyme